MEQAVPAAVPIRTETERDSQGNSHTTHHSNSGGFSGSRGHSGSTPSSPLYSGSGGNAGAFAIEVARDDGQLASYSHRYDLMLLDFLVVEEPTPDTDGVIEFGELVLVKNLRVLNSGAMPTPRFQRFRMALAAGPWVRPEGDPILVGESIPPGGEAVLPGPLLFRVFNPTVTDPGDPLVATELVRPRAYQLGPESEPGTSPFERLYEKVVFTKQIEAKFPVANHDGVHALRSLSPGEETELGFEIRNLSNRAIGRLSDRRRQVALQLYVPPKPSNQPLRFVGDDGQSVLLADADAESGYTRPIDLIPIDESVKTTGRIGFLGDAPPYSGTTVRCTVWLSQLDDRDSLRCAQHREFTLRCEPGFDYSGQAQVVLVTNNNTSREAFVAWRKLLQEDLGLRPNQWSITRYGHFDHTVTLEDGTNLQNQFEDKVVIVLNQPFNPGASAETDLPTEYLKGSDFRVGATAYNTHYLLVGSNEFDMAQLLEPTSKERDSGEDFPSIARYLEKEVKTGGSLTEETFRDDITRHVDVVPAEDWRLLPFLKPRTTKVMAAALKLQKRLARMHPNRRYVVVAHVEEPEKMSRKWGIFPRWRVGHIEVRRTLNTESSSAVLVHSNAAELNQSDFVMSEEVRFALLLSLPFAEKLERLRWMLDGSDEETDRRLQNARLLVHAILVDLTEEQSALRRARGSFDDEWIDEKLSNFGRLLRQPFDTQFEDDSPKWAIFFELVAGIEALSRAQKRWWMWFGRNKTVSNYVLERLEWYRGELFGEWGVDPSGDVAMAPETAVERINPLVEGTLAKIREYAKASGLSIQAAARSFFTTPSDMTSDVSRDVEAWLDLADRVLISDQFDQAIAKEEARNAKQDAMRAQNRETRDDLLVDEADTEVAVDATEAQLVDESAAVES